MLVCQDRECGYRKGISRVTNARCPNCHKKLELRGEGEGQTFVCSCGYREKLTAFNNRKRKNKIKHQRKTYLIILSIKRKKIKNHLIQHLLTH